MIALPIPEQAMHAPRLCYVDMQDFPETAHALGDYWSVGRCLRSRGCRRLFRTSTSLTGMQGALCNFTDLAPLILIKVGNVRFQLLYRNPQCIRACSRVTVTVTVTVVLTVSVTV